MLTHVAVHHFKAYPAGNVRLGFARRTREIKFTRIAVHPVLTQRVQEPLQTTHR